jgi:hypothetical protein
MDKTLDEIFIKHGTDKSTLGHSYGQHYEKHLPKTINSFLEVGTWKGAGIKSFKEWYEDKGAFWVLERYIHGHGLASVGQMQLIGINYLDGDHDNEVFLKGIKETFTVISEDGSHHWFSQIMVFKNLFVNNLEKGGLYVIEDVFDDKYWSQNNKVNENIKTLFLKWKEHKSLESQIISKAESDVISQMIEEVYIYHEIIFVTKKC